MPRPGLPDFWIGLKFEKLSDLCFKCGILGHAEKECVREKAILSNQHGVKFPTFGEWIRSENDKVPLDIYAIEECTSPIHGEKHHNEYSPVIALSSSADNVDPLNDHVGMSSARTVGMKQLVCGLVFERPRSDRKSGV